MSGNEVAVEATEDPNDVELAALRERLDRAGWPVHDHPDGRVAIDVSSPGRRARASVRRTAKATFRISTSVSKVPITSELGRWAVARFLLSAAAGYRVVRPAARSDRTVHLEVELHPEDADRGIDLCLGALAHASRDSAREVELLAGNPQAAAAYAAVLPDAETPTLQEE